MINVSDLAFMIPMSMIGLVIVQLVIELTERNSAKTQEDFKLKKKNRINTGMVFKGGTFVCFMGKDRTKARITNFTLGIMAAIGGIAFYLSIAFGVVNSLSWLFVYQTIGGITSLVIIRIMQRVFLLQVVTLSKSGNTLEYLELYYKKRTRIRRAIPLNRVAVKVTASDLKGDVILEDNRTGELFRFSQCPINTKYNEIFNQLYALHDLVYDNKNSYFALEDAEVKSSKRKKLAVFGVITIGIAVVLTVLAFSLYHY